MAEGGSARDESAREREEPLFAFVHIPKTAGGTTISMLTRAYGGGGIRNVGNFFEFPDGTISKISRTVERKRGARVLVGHVPIGVFSNLLPDDTRYFTILRDPVERVLSHYYRHIGAPRSENSKKPRQQTLEEVLTEGLVQVSDLQTRMLCDEPELPAELPARALDQAKANLTRMALVGIQERFNESLVLLERALGVDSVVPYTRNRHVGGERPSARDLAPAERALIEDANTLDMELYDYGRKVFERAAAAAGEGLGEDVEELRAKSAEASSQAEAITAAATEWLRMHLPPGRTRPIAEILAAAAEVGISQEVVRRARQQLPGVRRSLLDDGLEVWTASPEGFKDKKRAAKEERRRTGVKPRPTDRSISDASLGLWTAEGLKAKKRLPKAERRQAELSQSPSDENLGRTAAFKEAKRLAKEERRRTGVKPRPSTPM